MIDIEVLIGFTGAVFAGIGLIFNGLAHKAEANSRFFETSARIYNDITKLESSQERNSDRRMAGAKYLSYLDNLAMLATKRKIPKKVAEYFNTQFGTGLALLEEEDFRVYDPRQNKESSNTVKYLVKWCEKYKIDKIPGLFESHESVKINKSNI